MSMVFKQEGSGPSCPRCRMTYGEEMEKEITWCCAAHKRLSSNLLESAVLAEQSFGV